MLTIPNAHRMADEQPTSAIQFRNPAYFQFHEVERKWSCVVCKDLRLRTYSNALRHEKTDIHQRHIALFISNSREVCLEDLPRETSGNSSIINDLVNELLHLPRVALPPQAPSSPHHNHVDDEREFHETSDWLLPGIHDEIWHLDPDQDEVLRERIRAAMENSDSEEVLDPSNAIHSNEGTEGAAQDVVGGSRRRRGFRDPNWLPWSDRVECTVDIATSLPRSVFSDLETSILLWLLKTNGVKQVSTISQIKDTRTRLQTACGIRTKQYIGPLGHTYYVNDLAAIVAQEMANPEVRPKLTFYPEECEKHLKECWQGSKWLHRMPAETLTPMIRLSGNDFFIFEPARLNNGLVVMPFRWFVRKDSSDRFRYWARAWRMVVVESGVYSGWCIEQYDELTVCQSDLLWNYNVLSEQHNLVNLPRPNYIWGYRLQSGGAILEWDIERYPLPSNWRTKANDHRIYSLPIWLYCDDTSGNRSKKWNEHNSYLFTLAGLPRAETAKPYHVHFLCTSNLAPPLEMLDGVAKEIEDLAKDGTWAYDAVHREMVLVFVSVLALLGDNPMQSEWACHIGMRGKFFCRICDVKGRDAADEGIARQNTTRSSSSSSSGEEVPSSTENNGQASTGRRRAAELIDDMMHRVARFMQIGNPRQPKETKDIQVKILEMAATPGTKQARRNLRTASGVKDTLLESLLERVDFAGRNKRGQAALEAVKEAWDRLPSPFNPVWRLAGIDPHADTPVEILHVLLLGVVKYFWRDAINRLSETQKDLLKTRLASLDIVGLDPSLTHIPASTLVAYSGSLVGRDFRTVAQIAPFVLYDLLPERIYSGWLSLAAVVRLAWQPELEEIDVYASTLKTAIDELLKKSALWTPRWFNKPKFHVLLHLPDHVREFGPAILFATETFESYNAIIRSWSIHSNRQAPSRDIAHAAARWNRIRHITSGGFFPPDTSDDPPIGAEWVQAGLGVVTLIRQHSVINNKLGLDVKTSQPIGTCGQFKDQRIGRQKWEHTAMSRLYRDPSHLFQSNSRPVTSNPYEIILAHHVIVGNGDTAYISSYVIVKGPGDGSMEIAQLDEIVRWPSSNEPVADFLLISCCDVSTIAKPYRMPTICLTGRKRVIKPMDALCVVNTQHDCARYKCNANATQRIRQERILTDLTEKRIQHQTSETRILNTAKMRDAALMQSFIAYQSPQEKESVLHAIKFNYLNDRL